MRRGVQLAAMGVLLSLCSAIARGESAKSLCDDRALRAIVEGWAEGLTTLDAKSAEGRAREYEQAEIEAHELAYRHARRFTRYPVAIPESMVKEAEAEAAAVDEDVVRTRQLLREVGADYLAMALASHCEFSDVLPVGFAQLAWQAGASRENRPDPPCSSPTVRFADCGNGTVTDMYTGLIYLKNVGCLGPVNWTTARSVVEGLRQGECDLTDGSRPGDWRLQTGFEWKRLLKSDCARGPKIVGNRKQQQADDNCFNKWVWASGIRSECYWAEPSVNPPNSVRLEDASWWSGPWDGALCGVWPVRGPRPPSQRPVESRGQRPHP